MNNFSRGLLGQLRAIFQDPGVLLLMVIAPIAYAFFYALPYLNDRAEVVPVAVVDAEGGTLSRQLIRWMRASPRLEVALVSRDSAEAERAFARGEVRGILWLPQGWESDFRRGIQLTFPTAGDGSSFLVAREGLLGMAEVTGTLAAGVQIKRLQSDGQSTQQAAVLRDPLRIEVLRSYNPTESYLLTVYLSVAVLILQQTQWLGMAMAGATQRMKLPSGNDGSAVLLGRGVANFGVILTQSLIITGPVFSVFHCPFPDDRWGAILLLTILALNLTLYGSLLGGLFRERESSPALWVGTSIPMLFLAGSIWPVESMLPLATWLRNLFPSTPGIQGLLLMWVHGAHASELSTLWRLLASQAMVAAALLLLTRRKQLPRAGNTTASG